MKSLLPSLTRPRTLPAIAALAFGLAHFTLTAPAAATPPYRIIGYAGGRTDYEAIDAAKLTHVNYAFALVSTNGEVYFRRQRSHAALRRLLALKQKNPALKILVSVGGWGADNFSDAALTDASRGKFARSAAEFARTNEVDGIDLDWEFPGQRGPGIKYRPADKQNFTLMLRTVRRHLDALSRQLGRTGEDRLLLTIASNDNQRYFDHTEMDKLHVYLDFINIMTYDSFSSGSRTTGHHTGLYRSQAPRATDRTAANAVQLHLNAGIPPGKIVLGAAFYGRGWTGVEPKDHGLYQPFERFARTYDYSRLEDSFINKNGFVRHWDDDAKAPYLWNAQSRTFISYDDPESLKHKAAFVRDKGLGGIMYWEHRHDPKQLLLRTLHDNLQTRPE